MTFFAASIICGRQRACASELTIAAKSSIGMPRTTDTRGTASGRSPGCHQPVRLVQNTW
jgi:hypothetical protein